MASTRTGIQLGARAPLSAPRLPTWLWALTALALLACKGGDGGGDGGGADVPDGSAPITDTRSDDTSSPPAEVDAGPTCVPDCTQVECGDDGCGGSCGGCASGRVCTEDGICVPNPEDCDETCESLDMVCGEHCGEVCGSCEGEQVVCEHGACVCQPACDVAVCEQDDGCEGVCPPCPSDVSCADCPMVLTEVERELGGEALVSVTLALDFLPPEGAAEPGMADIRLRATGHGRLDAVALGEALMAADKELYVDAMTGKPFRELADGTIQLLILSTTDTQTIGVGRWLFLKFVFPPSDDPEWPAVYSLVKREQTLAPPLADQVLWGAELDQPVVVWPEEVP